MAYIYKNGAWSDYEPHKYGVNTVSFTSYPFTLKSKISPVTATVYGNMQQSGTPTPAAPIYPTETGDKTGNLYNYATNETGYRIQWTTGNAYADETAIMSDYIPVTTNTYWVSTSSIIIGYDSSKTYVGVYRGDLQSWEKSMVADVTTFSITSESGISYVRLLTYSGGQTPLSETTMLNIGSTTLPYEPYGIKIPILSGSTTTNVYLGEVQSVRHIRKYEFTGQESGWGKTSTGRMRCALPNSPLKGEVCFCSHYVGTNTNQISSINDGECTISVSAYDFVVYDADYTTYEDYVTWVAQQYANGTPVCIWYVLATETTGIVNEPIRKIGDYSDSVTASIPVIVGSDTVDIDTSLKPSAVSAPSLSWGSGEDHKYSSGSWS